MGRRPITAAIFAFIAVLVPVVVALGIIWARHEYYRQSPAIFDANAPTISRAISEPGVAETFALVMTLAAGLLALVVWRIVELYRLSISIVFRGDPRGERLASGIITLAAISQACSVAGILLLSWFSDRTLHIGGSYLFFFGQTFAILFSGLTCLMLLQTPTYNNAADRTTVALSPRISKWRWRAASLITIASLVFWVLYIVRENSEPAPHWVHQAFSILEMILIASFLLYLATFSSELGRS
jgi:hypothetical protein